MQTFIVLSALVAVAVAAPGYLSSAYAPYAYHAGAPIGHDGRVVDTPEVEHAKAIHFAAHASESARNSYGYAGYAPALAYVAAAPHVSYPVHHGYAPAAPLAADGRVVDTPEVAHAKAAHLAAHAQEAAKTGHAYGALAYAQSPIYAYGYASAAPIGHDGRVVDTPEVAHAKAAHLAAHAAAASHY